MQRNEILAAEKPPLQQKLEQVASWSHLVGFLLIGAGVVAFGFFAQHAPSSGGAAASRQFTSHSVAIPIYLAVIFMDWALLYYCLGGVQALGGSFWALSGGRWKSWKSVAVDLAIVVPFWLGSWGATYGVYWLLKQTTGPSTAKTVASLLPKSLLEVLIWTATSITAGVCEEMVFRGYLQRQLHALSGSVVLAVLGQGLVFGLFHTYQGWRNVVNLCVFGVLYGALAAWRGNLRVNIAAHAWTDFWAGWFKFVLWR
jgi:membrane protease YdiL (CAAX protease family)